MLIMLSRRTAYLRMTSVESHSTPRRKKKGKEETMERNISVLITIDLQF